jgi:hypothetical protein
MSGPKVVRVVTREELLAQSMAISARLQDAILRWQAAARDAEDLGDEEIAQTRARQEKLLAELNVDRFAEFNRGANSEIVFLSADTERRRELAAAHRANLRTSRLRAGQNAATLTVALSEKKVAVDPEILRVLDLASRGRGDMQAVEAALASGFRLLAPSEPDPSVSQTQRELAARLAAGAQEMSFSDWKNMQTKARRNADDPRLEEISRQLEMLGLLDNKATGFEGFEVRLQACIQESSDIQRSMKLDTLLFELASAVREMKRVASLADEAGAVLAELASLEGEQSVELRAQLMAAVVARDVTSMKQGMQAARAILTDAETAAAAHARRSAVLEGLAKLGYTIHEGMETAWIESGRIVVQKVGLSDYGVELAGAPDAQRMQVRTVALGSAHNTSRDTDAEQLWCGDFDKLKSDLSLQGAAVFVDKAMRVGEVPLKLVSVPVEHVSGSTSAASKTSTRAGSSRAS